MKVGCHDDSCKVRIQQVFHQDVIVSKCFIPNWCPSWMENWHRILYGFGLGISLRSGPTFLREMVPPGKRESLLVTIKLAMILGMIIGYIVGGLIGTKMFGEPQGMTSAYLLLVNYHMSNVCAYKLQKR